MQLGLLKDFSKFGCSAVWTPQHTWPSHVFNTFTDLQTSRQEQQDLWMKQLTDYNKAMEKILDDYKVESSKGIQFKCVQTFPALNLRPFHSSSC